MRRVFDRLEWAAHLTDDHSAFVPLPDLRVERPRQFVVLEDLHGVKRPLFRVEQDGDYDWLEERILVHGYYEQEREWTYTENADQKMMAQMLSLLGKKASLELGCTSGPLVSCLLRHGVDAWGVDLSTLALARAPEAVRPKLIHGDLLTVRLERRFGLIAGLDIFEHLNPNKLPSYWRRVHTLLEEDGLLFVNSPIWGADRVFGTVFPLEKNDVTSSYAEWREEHARRSLFTHLPVDGLGFPLMGHLVWAGSEWWEKSISDAGFVRQVELERALHGRFDAAINANSVARRSFLVLSKSAKFDAQPLLRVIERV